MSQFSFYAFALLLALFSFANAQTWTNCDPLNKTCPGDIALGISNAAFDFTEGLDSNVWNVTAGAITTGSNGAEYVIKKRFDSPTIQSEFYFMFGVVEVHMQAATGQGIISSIVLESDDLDEIDWELMGGNTTHVETNYFGKGNETSYDRAIYYPVTVGGGPMETYHNYTVVWTSEKLEWWVDSSLVRTLAYADANGGNNYPQTPMTLRLGIWAGGDASNSEGTIAWAGGATDYSKVPFTMLVKNATVSDYGTGKLYTYSDTSGSWQSITSTAGMSVVAKEIQDPSSSKSTSASAGAASSSASSTTTSSSATASAEAASATASSESIAHKWAAMSNTAHVAVYAGGAVGIVALAGLISLCCIKQRRRGMRDREAENARLQAQRQEDAAYAGMELKEQDALPFDTPTPAQFASRDNSMKDEGYFGPRDASPAPPPMYQNAANDSLVKDGTRFSPRDPSSATLPAYQNQSRSPGFENTNSMERIASPPVYNGSGFNFNSSASSRGPPSPVSPVSPTGFTSNNGGYGHGGFAGNSYSNLPSTPSVNREFSNGGYSSVGGYQHPANRF